MNNDDKLYSPRVIVVVLTYNGRDHLTYSLPTIAATDYPNFDVIVVVNGSTDGSEDVIRTVLPSARMIGLEKNAGWAGGNNQGIIASLQTDARYVVLTGNDIRVDPRWLRAAVELAERDARVGVIGFHIIEPVDHDRDWDAGFEDAKARWNAVRVSYPQYVGGMAMFVRSEVFRRIGLIDETFYCYGEEVDFQIRAAKAGYRIVAINVPVWHYGSSFFSTVPVLGSFLQTRANIRLLIKHATIRMIFPSAVRHVVGRCFPYRGSEGVSAVERRLRASSPLMAFGILLYALLWNLVRLPDTLQRRAEDDRRAALANRMWSDGQVPA